MGGIGWRKGYERRGGKTREERAYVLHGRPGDEEEEAYVEAHGGSKKSKKN